MEGRNSREELETKPKGKRKRDRKLRGRELWGRKEGGGWVWGGGEVSWR